ncbi:serine/threonine protein phosphatase [Labilibacter sediminis]|nr:serine/threonine protein phosphatase [Labilibacter sediminis]
MEDPKRVIAIGDIHGCFDPLKKLIEDKIKLQKTDRIIFLGDYVDRGPQSKEVVDYIISLQEKEFDIITLMGNHESMLLNAFTEDQYIPLWLYNGGSETLKSFGLSSTVFLPEKYRAFFQNLDYYYGYKQFLFVHAGFNDQIINPFEDTYYMLWTRSEHYTNPILEGKTIVHGHSVIPVEFCKSLIKLNSNIINIDTGCVYAERPGCGKLTAFDVISKRIFSA